MSDIKLPPLPVAYGGSYTASQMRDYARQCILADRAARDHAVREPMQPIIKDIHGVDRFRANAIVEAIYNETSKHGYDMNRIAGTVSFNDVDRMQFAQLLGYSISGYGDLSYVTDKSYDRAYAAAPTQERGADDCQCATCKPLGLGSAMRMILCPTCGNKRCPHATNHIHPCTGSNEPGQPGSAY